MIIESKYVTQYDNCSICTEVLSSHDPIAFPCGHAFGRSCFLQWADQCKAKNVIPKCCLCRSTVEEHLYRPKKTLLDRSVEQVKVLGYLGLSALLMASIVPLLHYIPDIFSGVLDSLTLDSKWKNFILQPTTVSGYTSLMLLAFPFSVAIAILILLALAATFESGLLAGTWIDALYNFVRDEMRRN